MLTLTFDDGKKAVFRMHGKVIGTVTVYNGTRRNQHRLAFDFDQAIEINRECVDAARYGEDVFGDEPDPEQPPTAEIPQDGVP